MSKKESEPTASQRTIKPLGRFPRRDAERSNQSPTRREWDRGRGRQDEPVIQADSFKRGKERLSSIPKPSREILASRRKIVRAKDYDSRIVINGNNNVIVQGDITSRRPRPYIPRRLYGDRHHFHRHSGWRDHGSFFSFTFSLNSCGRIAYVPYHGYYGFTYYYPSYHRRYVFVSVGGWWPYHYRYRRYYWYGCHPYYWYGPTIVREYPVVNEYNTYNTYNYYGSTTTNTSESWRYPFGDDSYNAANYINKISPVDEPEFETAADLCFAQAVDLFTAGKYEDAAAQFREAIRISPNDIILPFTYSQALFAEGDYALAAAVLRGALANIPADELTIYYPRGLYQDEEVLLAQITALQKAAAAEPFAGDYHLLLGYQYLGLGDLDKTVVPLTKAAADPANEKAAGMLIALAAELEEEATVEK